MRVGHGPIEERAARPIRAGWDDSDVPCPAGLHFAHQLPFQAAEDEMTPIQQRDRFTDNSLVTTDLAIDTGKSALVSFVQQIEREKEKTYRKGINGNLLSTRRV